jgi:hypothetical protein
MTSENLTGIILAIVGGIASFVIANSAGGWKMLLTKMFLAGFTGHLIYLATSDMNISESWVAVLCGLSGMVADNLLKFASSRLERYTKKHL